MPYVGPPRGSAVGDIGDDPHREGRVDGQHLFGIDPDLALAGDDRPVDLVVVLPGLQLGDSGPRSTGTGSAGSRPSQ